LAKALAHIMSYDYYALCTAIESHLEQYKSSDELEIRLKAGEQALNLFQELSTHCPMTPWLWMRYAYFTEAWMLEMSTDVFLARDSRISLLELGLMEFPGHAVLHWHYAQLLVERNRQKSSVSADDADTGSATIHNRLSDAIARIGSGSHANEGFWVLDIYRHWTQGILEDANDDTDVNPWKQAWCLRARVPWGRSLNDDLVQDLQAFAQHNSLVVDSSLLEQIEHHRRQAARYAQWQQSYQDEIDAQLHRQNLVWRPSDMSISEFDAIISGKSTNGMPLGYGMGLGDVQTAKAFMDFAHALQKYKCSEDASIEQVTRTTTAAVYERAVAECPTVESLWVDYAVYLQRHLPERHVDYAQVVDRAVRNNPYSLSLTKIRLNASFYLSQYGLILMDPEDILKQAQSMLDRKFLTAPSDVADVYLTAIRAVVKRVLFLSSGSVMPLPDSKQEDDGKMKGAKAFDDAIPMTHKGPWPQPTVLSDEDQEETGDLLEDITDMIDAVNSSLSKQNASFSQCRAVVLQEAALIESIVMQPLRSRSQSNSSTNNHANGLDSESWKYYTKAIRLHHPSHPDAYLQLIRHVMLSADGPAHPVARIQRIRGLYQAAVLEVGETKEATRVDRLHLRDYSVALHDMCSNWRYFEEVFGSDKSLSMANHAIEKKYRKARSMGDSIATVDITYSGHSMTASSTKRHIGGVDDSGGHVAKKPRLESAEVKASTNYGIHSTDAQSESRMDHETAQGVSTVAVAVEHDENEKIGNGDHDNGGDGKNGTKEFHAHPFTVRVLNLAPTAKDMDLVELLRKRCGPIVHARIVRERHGKKKGQSKGWGLVQFEESESVDKALALSGEIGMHDRVVTIERSHMSAVNVVPTDSYTTTHQSKRNFASAPVEQEIGTVVDDLPTSKTSEKGEAATQARSSLLQPRAVSRHRGKAQPKPKSRINLT
jgi:RNA recognition motif. (a.k.a. RRM, RBD, or RNP domain)